MPETPAPLPTVEQCHEFMAAVNRGREAFDLPPLESLDYDICKPEDPQSCLSATHLFTAIEHDTYVGTDTIRYMTTTSTNRLADALDADFDFHGEMKIPESILAVTDPFDQYCEGLRDRLVEAGLVHE